MGTPDIAVTCLEALIAAGENIVGVVTRIDKPKGRRAILTPPPVKVCAEAHGIEVCQPRTLRDEAFDEYLRALAPDLILVVAFGMILPPSVISYPKYGCLNVHASLLPKYRGAAPMQRAIMEGERETGVTIMYMDEGLDTGDMITWEATPISDTDTLETVHDRLAEMGARMLVEAARLVVEGKAVRVPQNGELSSYAAKIERADAKLDFTRTATELDRQIRALSPMPLAYCVTPDGKSMKIVSAHRANGSGVPGTVLSTSCDGVGEITVACGEGALSIRVLQPEGKGKMDAAAYLRGRRLSLGEVLS
jgi:methionyl-tRNA formyltransferase